MKNEQALCIDFGSAYTKIAFRTGWSHPAKLTPVAPLTSQDSTYYIPSVVAHVQKSGPAKWVVGARPAHIKLVSAIGLP